MKKRGKKSLPTKTVLNLVINEIPPHYYRNLVIVALIVAVAILAFAKFAVIDKLALVDEEWRKTDILSSQVAILVDANSSYFEVREKYDLYFTDNTTKGTVVDVMEVFRIIDKHLSPVADILSVTMADNTMTVLLGGITLNEATGILLKLYETEPIVVNVEIFTVTSLEGERPSLTMTVALNPLGGTAQ